MVKPAKAGPNVFPPIIILYLQSCWMSGFETIKGSGFMETAVLSPLEIVTPTLNGVRRRKEGRTTDRRKDGKRRQEERRGGKKERGKRFAVPHVWMRGRARSPATEGESLFMAPNYHYITAQLFKLQLFHLLVICTRARSAVTFPAPSRP